MTRAASLRLALLVLFASFGAACRDKTAAAPDAGVAARPSASAAPSASAPVLAKPFEAPFPDDAGTGWEGIVRMSLTGGAKKEEIPVLFMIRGDRIRYEAPNGYNGMDATTVVDVGMRRLALFTREQEKQFLRFDLPPAAPDAGAFALPRTGKTQTVMGLDCDVYELKRGKASSTACIHEGIPFVEPGMAVTGLTAPGWVRSLSITKRFLVRAVEVDDKGVEVYRLETKAVTAGPIRVPMNVPQGYTQISGKVPGSPFRPGLPD